MSHEAFSAERHSADDAAAAFRAVDIRVGTIVAAEPLAGARNPAYKLEIEFGPEIGRRISTARLTDCYAAEALLGRQILGVVNLPPKRVAGVKSEVLVTGVADTRGAVVLVVPDPAVAHDTIDNGAKLY